MKQKLLKKPVEQVTDRLETIFRRRTIEVIPNGSFNAGSFPAGYGSSRDLL